VARTFCGDTRGNELVEMRTVGMQDASGRVTAGYGALRANFQEAACTATSLRKLASDCLAIADEIDGLAVPDGENARAGLEQPVTPEQTR
jgi:hypothetical protein